MVLTDRLDSQVGSSRVLRGKEDVEVQVAYFSLMFILTTRIAFKKIYEVFLKIFFEYPPWRLSYRRPKAYICRS